MCAGRVIQSWQVQAQSGEVGTSTLHSFLAQSVSKHFIVLVSSRNNPGHKPGMPEAAIHLNKHAWQYLPMVQQSMLLYDRPVHSMSKDTEKVDALIAISC